MVVFNKSYKNVNYDSNKICLFQWETSLNRTEKYYTWSSKKIKSIEVSFKQKQTFFVYTIVYTLTLGKSLLFIISCSTSVRSFPRSNPKSVTLSLLTIIAITCNNNANLKTVIVLGSKLVRYRTTEGKHCTQTEFIAREQYQNR